MSGWQLMRRQESYVGGLTGTDDFISYSELILNKNNPQTILKKNEYDLYWDGTDSLLYRKGTTVLYTFKLPNNYALNMEYFLTYFITKYKPLADERILDVKSISHNDLKKIKLQLTDVGDLIINTTDNTNRITWSMYRTILIEKGIFNEYYFDTLRASVADTKHYFLPHPDNKQINTIKNYAWKYLEQKTGKRYDTSMSKKLFINTNTLENNSVIYRNIPGHQTNIYLLINNYDLVTTIYNTYWTNKTNGNASYPITKTTTTTTTKATDDTVTDRGPQIIFEMWSLKKAYAKAAEYDGKYARLADISITHLLLSDKGQLSVASDQYGNSKYVLAVRPLAVKVELTTIGDLQLIDSTGVIVWSMYQELFDVVTKSSCVGYWGACNSSTKKQTYIRNDGTACPIPQKTQECDPNTAVKVDCEVSWGACDPDYLVETYSITKQPANGGKACPQATTKPCTIDTTTVVDCVGAWGDCVDGSQTYSITTAAANEGVACSNVAGDVRPCPVDCVGVWSECVDGKQTYSITTPAANEGQACNNAVGAEQICAETSPVNCVGYWGECLNSSQTYTITTTAAYDGTACSNVAGDTQTCTGTVPWYKNWWIVGGIIGGIILLMILLVVMMSMSGESANAK